MAVEHLEVTVHHRRDMPAGLPAVWVKDLTGSTAIVSLYLRSDLPAPLEDAYRCMVTREVFPDGNMDAYSVTTEGDDRAIAMGPSLFA